ncbi:cobalamin biosynthesis protein CbiE [Tumebacillus algifaecis]|uniref:Cobalamin biosynthesis protein CbiE n=1 Tax=Tumebacillus algifaecis TaxID=1214604 RepID=A0A223D4L3_9BACL|nr:precorrin-6y C5,15-methyltransferase (decarboxylating) subunit CbiE [Tumebacillus algifaecis]ASS76475.1 cobalamin biosynthesis protein CbiE [Tumebacillus algifaecis]
MNGKIHVIGIGDDGVLAPEQHTLVKSSDILIGGERHLAFFPDATGEKWVIKGGLTELVKKIEAAQGTVTILASGDPLFYGIGGYLAKKLDGVVIHPHFTSVQLAFTRLGVSWQDAYITSLHGKSIKGLAQKIDGQHKVALLTDDTNTPSVIADYLLSFGMTEYQAFVAENLGGATERCGLYELEELQGQSFSSLNVVLLLQKPGHTAPRWGLGIDDDQFSQRKPDKGLITKKEVRVLSLSELNLHRDSTVWDIGTCTASVSIEAARIARDGAVYAIEKNEPDLGNARANAAKFRADITFVHGKAPEGLTDWPDPDAVFIGGSGGEMAELLQICADRLRPNGRIVLNAATIETLYEATQTFSKVGLSTRVTLLQTSRSKPILHMTRFEGLNPIYIITAYKEESQT